MDILELVEKMIDIASATVKSGAIYIAYDTARIGSEQEIPEWTWALNEYTTILYDRRSEALAEFLPNYPERYVIRNENGVYSIREEVVD